MVLRDDQPGSSPPPPPPATPSAKVPGSATKAPDTGWLGTGLPSWAPMAAILIGAVLITAALKRRHKNLVASERELLSAAQGVRALPAPRPTAASSRADLRDAVEDAIARLDDKAAVLQRLIREADLRIARLDRAAGGQPSRPPTPAPDADGFEPGEDVLTREIYRLADDGLTHVQIAQRLGQHVGHVGLVLALRR